VTVIGIHTNAQNKSLTELIKVWTHADRLGYGWISISDHFAGSLGPVSNEAVSTQTALAACTSRAQCGVLVYSIGFRHPAVLVGAATTIDHLSNGRAAIGIGAGSAVRDYELYGFPYPDVKTRMDMLEEGVRCVTGLLRGETVDFVGKHFQLTGARNGPAPMQARLPVWVGTGGARRGLRIAATYADGWNNTFPTLESFVEKRSALLRHCDDLGRDPAEIRCSVNLMLGLGKTPESIPERFRPAALTGSVDQVVDAVERYAQAGADQVNFFLDHPWDYDGLAELATAFHLTPA
jgi:alkanesulfonate monooxygenase SsuD/methylene tetrahydromethanopterin reductase-like flavin-dependent oxidoreductase (luciferase family)